MTNSGQFEVGRREVQARKTTTLLMLSAAVFVPAAPAHAEFVQFTFIGDVEMVTGIPPEPWKDIQIGDEWTFSYVFDTETSDLAGGPLTGVYAIKSLEAGIDGVFVDSVGIHEIYVEPTIGVYRVSFSELSNGVFGELILNTPGTFRDGDDLPATLDLDDFLVFPGQSYFYLQDSLKSFNILGYPHTLDIHAVPVPGMLIPLGILVGGYITSRRQRTVVC